MERRDLETVRRNQQHTEKNKSKEAWPDDGRGRDAKGRRQREPGGSECSE